LENGGENAAGEVLALQAEGLIILRLGARNMDLDGGLDADRDGDLLFSTGGGGGGGGGLKRRAGTAERAEGMAGTGGTVLCLYSGGNKDSGSFPLPSMDLRGDSIVFRNASIDKRDLRDGFSCEGRLLSCGRLDGGWASFIHCIQGPKVRESGRSDCRLGAKIGWPFSISPLITAIRCS